MTNHERRKEWEIRIADFISSGQSGAAWCASNNINIQQFYYWKRRLKSDISTENQSTQWVSFEVDNPPQIRSGQLLIRVGEVAIEVKNGYDPDLLLNVIQTLRASC